MDIRIATDQDIKKLSFHHRMMFEDICQNKGSKLPKERSIEIERAYEKKLETELCNGTCKAWVVVEKSKVVASGAITLVSFVPNPSDLSSKVAYLHSMYTERSHRNKGYAQKIIEQVLDHCKSQGIKRITLNASNEGKPVYEKIGFKTADNFMRLLLK